MCQWILPPPPLPSSSSPSPPIQLCIQLWLSLFNTHNYQAIIMIIGFTSLIVCLLAHCSSGVISYECVRACVGMYDELWFVCHTAKFICYHFVTLTRWMLWVCVFMLSVCSQSLRVHGCCCWIFFCVVHLFHRAYCVVAESLTFSTINCILICMGIHINEMGWYLLPFYHYYFANGRRRNHEIFHQLLNKNQKLFLKMCCAVCYIHTYIYIYVYICMHACMYKFFSRPAYNRVLWFTRKNTMKINVIWFIIYDSMGIKTAMPH